MPLSDDFNFNATGYFDAFFKNTKKNTILLMDETGTVTNVNDAFVESFGFSREDIVGKNFAILFTEADKKAGMPQNEIAKVLSEGQSADNNFLVHKDATLTWVAGESILIHGAEPRSVLKVFQNINRLKISEQFIAQLNIFNESILRSIEDVVIVLSPEFQIIKVNKAFAKLFGIAAPEQDLNFIELIKPFDTDNTLLRKLQHLLATRESFLSHEQEIGGIDSEKKIFNISCCILDHPGTNGNILFIAHDITIQKQTEKEREDIIGFVAHELRNPLANIVLCNEMMTQLITDGEMNNLGDYLNRSKNNVMRLNKMIGELYDATKFNSGNFILEKTPFDFEEMIEEALDTIEVLHPDYSINVEGECPLPVYGDRYRLIQVVTNFLSNGIKYSNNNTTVLIHIKQENNNVTVSVKDEGLGISPRQLPHIFGRFFRAERTKNMEGIGLGLYLCRRIIEAHKGKIWAESEEGNGSVFYFSIPIT